MTSDDPCKYGSSGDTCGPLMSYDVCICKLEEENEGLQINLNWCCDAFEDAVQMIGMDDEDKEGIEVCRSLLSVKQNTSGGASE